MTLTQVTKAGLDALALDHVFTIGASGSSAYTFQGEGLNGTVNNPTLYLTRGKTYRFENGSGGHPIRIQSTSGASGTAYNTGVTNNAGSGTVIVEVQHDAPDVLYYQCTSHPAMNGTLYITGALADGGVTTAKLADDAVDADKLANSINTAIAANTAKTSNATHTGDVTGSTSLTIAADAVTNAKIADGAVDSEHLAVGCINNSSFISGQVINTGAISDEAVTLAKLPHGDASSDGKFLRANNGADPSFETVSIPAGTTINNNADNRIITGSGTANTLEAESNLTWDGTNLAVAGTGSNIVVPSGTTAQRNGSPANYSIRYNTTLSKLELYTGTAWKAITLEKTWDEENTATHWWKSEGIVDSATWNAQVGGSNANLTAGSSTHITYNSSDSGFNNQKTLDFNQGSDSNYGYLRTGSVTNGFWDPSEAWSVIMVIEKTDHNSGTGYGDGLFIQTLGSYTDGSWSVDIAGDHTWSGSYGEQVGGISGYNQASDYSTPKKGIFCFRADTNGSSSQYKFQPSGSNTFTTLGTASSFPSSIPGSGYNRLNIGNFYTTSSNHEWSGTIAEIAYYKGIYVSDTELTNFSTYAKAKFNI